MKAEQTHFLIIGAGIIGLSIAKALQRSYPHAKLTIIEKEPDVARHASGRNSGVLHAGFYYTADSLKARFTREGNAAMKTFCRTHGLQLHTCGKVVVARNEEERQSLHELFQRGKANAVDVTLIDTAQLAKIDPNAHTYKEALYSPSTATVNPVSVTHALKEEVLSCGAELFFNTRFLYHFNGRHIVTTRETFYADMVINTAGLYADRIAKQFDFGIPYTILPFKGIYLKYSKNDHPVKTNIYPVPNLKNPFLGVHYTITADKHIKIGPTAIPAFWRENYRRFQNFNLWILSKFCAIKQRFLQEIISIFVHWHVKSCANMLKATWHILPGTWA